MYRYSHLWVFSPAGSKYRVAHTSNCQLRSLRYSARKSYIVTRNLSYRKDDRANAPYGCHENFRESLSTPTATFPEISNGRLFRSIL